MMTNQNNINRLEHEHEHEHEHEQDSDTASTSSSPLLFSCRCESARAVSTLISCLRNVHISASSSNLNGTLSGGISNHQSRNNVSSISLMSQAATMTRTRRDAGTSLSVSETGTNSRGGKVQYATVFVSPEALTFHVQGFAKQSQASVQLQAGLFSAYHVGSYTLPSLQNEVGNDTEEKEYQSLTPRAENAVQNNTNEKEYETICGGEFCINLTTVIECLHILGTSNLDRTTLCLSYDRSQAIFKVELLEEHGYNSNLGSSLLSTCAIPGMAVPDDDGEDDENNNNNSGPKSTSTSLAVAFRNSPVVARAILSSSYLRPAIQELMDIPGASCCTVSLSPDGIEMGCIGFNDECGVSLPYRANNHTANGNFEGNDSETPAFISIECNPPQSRTNSYPLHSFIQGMRALEIANETCISINEIGMIAIQHQVLDKVGKGEPNFVDFIMSAMEDSDDETENEEEEEEEGADMDNIITEGYNEQSFEVETRQTFRSSQRNGNRKSSYNHEHTLPIDSNNYNDENDDNDEKSDDSIPNKPNRTRNSENDNFAHKSPKSQKQNTRKSKKDTSYDYGEKMSPNISSRTRSNSSHQKISKDYKSGTTLDKASSTHSKKKVSRTPTRFSPRLRLKRKERASPMKNNSKITSVSSNSSEDDDEFNDPNKTAKAGDLESEPDNEDGRSSPELLFGDTRLDPSPPLGFQKTSVNKEKRHVPNYDDSQNTDTLLLSAVSRRQQMESQVYNYSDDGTDDDEF